MRYSKEKTFLQTVLFRLIPPIILNIVLPEMRENCGHIVAHEEINMQKFVVGVFLICMKVLLKIIIIINHKFFL